MIIYGYISIVFAFLLCVPATCIVIGLSVKSCMKKKSSNKMVDDLLYEFGDSNDVEAGYRDPHQVAIDRL